MKKIIFALAAGALLLLGSYFGPATVSVAQNVACYMSQGGATWTLGSGCTLTVASGGVLNVASGGALQIGGVDVTSGAGGSNVAGVAAGYKIARGETALGGSNPTAVTTGLSTITGCSLTIKLATAPGVGTSVVTYGTSSGTMNMYGWKVTNSSTTTLIASTGTETIGWICAGT